MGQHLKCQWRKNEGCTSTGTYLFIMGCLPAEHIIERIMCDVHALVWLNDWAQRIKFHCSKCWASNSKPIGMICDYEKIPLDKVRRLSSLA